MKVFYDKDGKVIGHVYGPAALEDSLRMDGIEKAKTFQNLNDMDSTTYRELKAAQVVQPTQTAQSQKR